MNVRALRLSLGLTQEGFARRLGVSFTTVNRWEAGKNRPQQAQRDAIARLADEMQATVAEREAKQALLAAAVYWVGTGSEGSPFATKVLRRVAENYVQKRAERIRGRHKLQAPNKAGDRE